MDSERYPYQLSDFLRIPPDYQNKILVSALILLLLWLLRTVVIRAVCRKTTDTATRYRWRRTSRYVTATLSLLLLGRVWFEAFQSIATFLGLMSAGVAIALKDFVADLAGWLFIVMRRPLEVGDRIQIGPHAGDVIDQRIFKFTLMEIGNWVDADQSTGRIVHVPNSMVLSMVLINYSKGFQYIWNEIPVLVTFESDWEKAKSILQGIVDEHAAQFSEEARRGVKRAARKFLIYYSKFTPTVYTSVRESGVLLTIRHLCGPRQRRGIEEAIWEDILRNFVTHKDIDFAYPTQRFYDNRTEGKEGAGTANRQQ